VFVISNFKNVFHVIKFTLAYGIHKLQISCVVEDEKVSIDWLQETLQEIEDFVRIILIIQY
jgi:translation elongation factor EF-1beta